jgi:ABC-type Mn2+/Zn2+ transport system ATPase subunit
MKFEVEYNEQLCRWRFRSAEGHWSQHMRSDKLLQAMYGEVREDQTKLVRADYRPIAHATKRVRTMDEQAQTVYEISGGKVQRIAFDRAERQAQQMAELAALLELD